MKKFIVIAIALFTAAAVYAQPRAVGVRLGSGFEASYQHFVRNADFVELDLGLGFPLTVNGLDFGVTALYDFVFAQPAWTTKGTWAWYAGPGATLGGQFFNNGNGAFYFGVGGNIGLSYSFWFPLELSIDNRVMLGYNTRPDHNFYIGGLLVPTLSVRYRF